MKKGFVFLETLIVLTVLLVSVVGMFSMYTKVSTDIENRKYYDNISDLYKTDVVRNYVDISKLNSSSSFIEVSKSNCSTYMKTNCSLLFDTLRISKVYINLDSINSMILSSTSGLNNSMREYLKSINKDNKRYIIVNYKYSDKNYYASLRI